MKRILLAASFMALFSTAGSAALVTFNTNGSLLDCNGASGCGGAGSSIVFSNNGFTLTITYTGNSQTNLNANSPGATTNFGQLSVTCAVDAGGSCGTLGNNATFTLDGAQIQLNINQTVPPIAAQDVFGVGTFSGSLTLSNGSFGGIGAVLFPSTNVTLASTPSVTYVLQQPSGLPNGYSVSIGNTTSIQGALVSNDIPEPSTLALIGFGLASLGLLRSRR